MKKQIFIAILMVALMMGCSKKQESKQQEAGAKTIAKSEQIAPTVKAVTLKELLKNPKTYEGQEVVIGGIFNSICCGSDFVLKDGFNSIEVYVTDQCPMPSKSKIGSKIEINGTVKVKGDEVTIVAKEVKFK